MKNRGQDCAEINSQALTGDAVAGCRWRQRRLTAMLHDGVDGLADQLVRQAGGPQAVVQVGQRQLVGAPDLVIQPVQVLVNARILNLATFLQKVMGLIILIILIHL